MRLRPDWYRIVGLVVPGITSAARDLQAMYYARKEHRGSTSPAPPPPPRPYCPFHGRYDATCEHCVSARLPPPSLRVVFPPKPSIAPTFPAEHCGDHPIYWPSCTACRIAAVPKHKP